MTPDKKPLPWPIWDADSDEVGKIFRYGDQFCPIPLAEARELFEMRERERHRAEYVGTFAPCDKCGADSVEHSKHVCDAGHLRMVERMKDGVVLTREDADRIINSLRHCSGSGVTRVIELMRRKLSIKEAAGE